MGQLVRRMGQGILYPEGSKVARGHRWAGHSIECIVVTLMDA